MKYFFIPGRKWHLALAELRAVLSVSDHKKVELSCGPDLFLYDIQASESDVADLFDRLGGFIKFGYIVDEPFKYLDQISKNGTLSHDEKINFAVSIYDSVVSDRTRSRKAMELGMKIKRWLKDEGFRCRFVSNPKEPVTSAVLIKKNDVLSSGFELLQLSHPKKSDTLWGITLRDQDFEGFAKRDYDRPRANKRKGMLPPKLARIMVNLAQIPIGGIIWDPFCGSGTVLMEAILLGYSVVGTDIDHLAIEESTENLDWVCNEYWISHENYALKKHDILDGIPGGVDFDAIVTEPFLGPVLRDEVTIERIEKITAQIEPLYQAISDIVSNSATDGRKMVIVVPGFKSPTGWIDMETPFENGVPEVADITDSLSDGPLQWDRSNSIIRRNIKIFEL